MPATKPSSNLSGSGVQQRTMLLGAMKKAVSSNKKQILDSLLSDLRKPVAESLAAEFMPVLAELDFAIDNLDYWSRQQELTPVAATFGKHFLLPQPIGKVLVISAWNYPFQLSLLPVINALAAGNEVVLKPSELAPATGQVIKEISKRVNSSHFKVVCGGKETAKELIDIRFNKIFFTGGQKTAKLILQAAAENLTPVTLELGGKCPCIIDESIDLDFAARRIVWGKMLNAGQTCIAPDYVFAPKKLVEALDSKVSTLMSRWSRSSRSNQRFGQIVNQKHFDRISSILTRSGKGLPIGSSRDHLRIPPSVARCNDLDCALLTEEIFGPILPIAEYDRVDQVIRLLNERPSPLAVYSFSNDPKFHERLMESTRSGGFCVNDVILHAVDPAIPFGGVGKSGTGKYRGKAGFDCFSHYKTVFANTECHEDNRVYPRSNRKALGKSG